MTYEKLCLHQIPIVSQIVDPLVEVKVHMPCSLSCMHPWEVASQLENCLFCALQTLLLLVAVEVQ